MSANAEGAKTKGDTQRLSPDQVADRLGVSVEHVIRLIDLKHLRAVDMAASPGPGKRRRWRISEADLAAFESARANGTPLASPDLAAASRIKSRQGAAQQFIE